MGRILPKTEALIRLILSILDYYMILSLDLTYNRSLQALSHHDIRCQLSLETVTEGAHDGLNR